MQPRVIVALGATAAKAVFGPTDSRHDAARQGTADATRRSRIRDGASERRAPAPGELRAEAEKAFVDDLKKVARYLARHTE